MPQRFVGDFSQATTILIKINNKRIKEKENENKWINERGDNDVMKERKMSSFRPSLKLIDAPSLIVFSTPSKSSLSHAWTNP